MKHYFLINPAAGKGKLYRRLDGEIRTFCEGQGVDYEVYYIANCEMSPNKNKLRRRPCGRVIAKKPPRQKLLDSRIDKNQTAKILRMERQSSGLAILPEMRTPIS